MINPAPDPAWSIAAGLSWPWCDYGCPRLSVGGRGHQRCLETGLPTEPDQCRVRSLCVPALQPHHIAHRRGIPTLVYCRACRCAVGHRDNRCLVCNGADTCQPLAAAKKPGEVR